MIVLENGLKVDQAGLDAVLRKMALPVGTKVEIVPRDADSTWPGGVGEIAEIVPRAGGYLVKHKFGTFGWCWDEVKPARPWWKRLLSKHPKRED